MKPRGFTNQPGEHPPASAHRTYTTIRLAQLERAQAALLEDKRRNNDTIARLRKENKRLNHMQHTARLVEEVHVIRD